jgi:hypothetical protein
VQCTYPYLLLFFGVIYLTTENNLAVPLRVTAETVVYASKVVMVPGPPTSPVLLMVGMGAFIEDKALFVICCDGEVGRLSQEVSVYLPAKI